MARKNYFIALELSPTEDWIQIEKVLKQKQNEWTQGLNHPVRKNEFKTLLSLIPEMKRLLQDPQLRKTEADEARKLGHKQKADLLAALDSSIELMASKGFMTEGDVTILVRDFGVDGKDVRDRCRRLNVQVTDPAAGTGSKAPPKDRIDEVLNAKIRRNLATLGKEDLYAFLDAPRRSSTLQLRNKANREYSTVRAAAVKTPEVTIRQELLGDCLPVFRSEAERAKYDNTLEWNQLEEIRKLAEQAGAGENMIRVAVTDELIKRGKKQGIAADNVVAAIRDVCARRKWSVEVPPVPTSAVMLRCGACGELAPPGTGSCPACRTPFQIACPRCHTSCSSSDLYCAKTGCGFPIGDMPYAERALRSARAALSGDPAEANRLVQEALTYWPDHPEAVRLRVALKQREQQLEQMIAPLEAALEVDRFESAFHKLNELEQAAPDHPGLANWRGLIQGKLSEAGQKVADGQAHECQGGLAAAISSYEDALSVCSDCSSARDGLARCPPAPPTDLSAEVDGRGVALRWQPSRSPGRLRYRVLRKKDSPPRSPQDGEHVATVAETLLLDTDAPCGTVLYYAVHAECGGVPSPAGARVDPLLRIAEVEELLALGRDGSVELSWRPPPEAIEVEVWRKAGLPPDRRGEGDRLPIVEQTRAVDTGLPNDRSLGYRVVVLFRGANGQIVPSSGKTTTAIPVTLPEPVKDLCAARRGREVEATWQPPSFGEVMVFLLHSQSKWPCGSLLPAHQLGSLGRRLAPLGPGRAGGASGVDSILHFLPVTVVGETAVVGQCATLSTIPDVEELKVRRQDDRLVCTWHWPETYSTAVVAWRHDRFPVGDSDPNANRSICERVRYDRHGGFAFPLPRGEQMFLTVYAVLRIGDAGRYTSATSPGVRLEVPLALCRRLSYRFGRARWLGLIKTGDYELRITPDEEMTLPALILIVRSGEVPFDREDGQLALAVPAGVSCTPSHPYVARVPAAGLPVRPRGQLFPVNAADARWIDLDRKE